MKRKMKRKILEIHRSPGNNHGLIQASLK